MTSPTHYSAEVYIGLGANLETPVKQLEKALESLSSLADSQLVKASSFYQTPPMGPQDQDDYVNAVALISTDLKPIELLDELQQIELTQGRVRKSERWGPRTLDLDILLYDNLVLNSTRLTIPHYGIKQRSFVLTPLLEISPDLSLPDGSTVKWLSEKIGNLGIVKL